MEGFYLYKNVIPEDLEKNIIFYIENDPRFQRFQKTGKIFYSMTSEYFPEEWDILQSIILSLNENCHNFDYALQLKYPTGINFPAHYDSKHRWGEFIAGVNLKTEAEIFFTKKNEKSVYIKIPPRSIYIMSGDCRYKWRHGIRKVKNLRYSITFRKIK